LSARVAPRALPSFPTRRSSDLRSAPVSRLSPTISACWEAAPMPPLPLPELARWAEARHARATTSSNPLRPKKVTVAARLAPLKSPTKISPSSPPLGSFRRNPLFWTTWTTNKIRHDRRQSPTRSALAAERHACAWRSATEGNGGSRFARRPGARPRELSLHRSDDAPLDGCRQLSSRCRHRRSHAFLRLRGNRRVPSSGFPKGRPRYG